MADHLLNVLPYLASLLWTACEGAALSIQYLKTYNGWAYKLIVFFLVLNIVCFQFQVRAVFSRNPLNSKLFGFSILLVCFGQLSRDRAYV